MCIIAEKAIIILQFRGSLFSSSAKNDARQFAYLGQYMSNPTQVPIACTQYWSSIHAALYSGIGHCTVDFLS